MLSRSRCLPAFRAQTEQHRSHRPPKERICARAAMLADRSGGCSRLDDRRGSRPARARSSRVELATSGICRLRSKPSLDVGSNHDSFADGTSSVVSRRARSVCHRQGDARLFFTARAPSCEAIARDSTARNSTVGLLTKIFGNPEGGASGPGEAPASEPGSSASAPESQPPPLPAYDKAESGTSGIRPAVEAPASRPREARAPASNRRPERWPTRGPGRR